MHFHARFPLLNRFLFFAYLLPIRWLKNCQEFRVTGAGKKNGIKKRRMFRNKHATQTLYNG